MPIIPYGNHVTYMISFSALNTLNEEGGMVILILARGSKGFLWLSNLPNQRLTKPSV